MELNVVNLTPGMIIPPSRVLNTPPGVITAVERRPCQAHAAWQNDCGECEIWTAEEFERGGERLGTQPNRYMTTEHVAVYAVKIQAAALNTPITLADSATLTEREVVGYRSADWQTIATHEVVSVPGAAAGMASDYLSDWLAAQDPEDNPGDGTVRCRVWEGADPDTGTAPTAEVRNEPTPVDWVAAVADATRARAQAKAALDDRERTWRSVVADAMRATEVPRQAVADAAGVSIGRAYQIRDGR